MVRDYSIMVKDFTKRARLFVLFSILSIQCFAYDFEVDGIYYYIDNLHRNNVYVTKGEIVEMGKVEIKLYQGNIEIPCQVIYKGKTYEVTSIGKSAFSGCNDLTSITIPNSITSIGSHAFDGCNNLISVISEIQNPFSINENVFYGISSNAFLIVPRGAKSKYESIYGWTKHFSKIEEGDIGAINYTLSVSSIGYGSVSYDGTTVKNETKAFTLNENSSATITFSPDHGYRISRVMVNNTDVTSSVSNNSYTVNSINANTTIEVELEANYANYSYDSTTHTLTIYGEGPMYPFDNEIYFPWYSYSGDILHLVIESGVTSISAYAFSYCQNVTSIFISNSVTYFSDMAFPFNGWKALASVIVEDGNTFYDSRENCNAIIETASNELILGCVNTIIPNSVSSIGEKALFSSSLPSITIPNSVTKIGYGAFAGCNGLTTIISEIENPFEIDDSVFSGVPSGAQLIVPKGTKAKYQATAGWNQFTNIVEVGGVGYRFEADGICYGIGENNTVYVTYKKAGYSGDVVIPSSVVYQGNTYRVTSIQSAFYECFGLTSVTIPSSVTSIGQWAFSESGLTSITIPNSVTSIGFEAFKNCDLTSVTIPSSVIFISPGAFNECYRLATVVSEIENPFWIADDTFSGIYAKATLIVPPGTKSAYQATEGWKLFTNIVEAGEEGSDLPGQIHKDDIYYKVIGSGEAEVVSVEEGEKSVSVPPTISHNNTTYKVTSIAKEVFENREYLAAVIWEPEAQFNAKVSNPNFLLYVKDEKYASHTVKNVVVNGVAETIELADAASGNDFYCPRAFTARKISYTHDYKMETGIGESKGWETIVLPFDVQKYTHAAKGEIESFTTWSMGSNKKPFWLFELTEGGFRDVAGIKANTPYIISMPNNRQYEQQYQMPGIVTFSATNVEVQKSDDLKSVSYQGRTFVPNYTNKTDDNCLALNVNSYYVTNSSKDKDGSKFIRGLRAVHPFEAYMTTSDGTRSIDVMDSMITAIKDIYMIPDDTEVIKVYDTKGILVKTVKAYDELRTGLAAGIYIVNGKKMILK